MGIYFGGRRRGETAASIKMPNLPQRQSDESCARDGGLFESSSCSESCLVGRISAQHVTALRLNTSPASWTVLGPVGASVAGSASTFSHDVMMTPLNTIKQRMQLGHYEGICHATPCGRYGGVRGGEVCTAASG